MFFAFGVWFHCHVVRYLENAFFTKRTVKNKEAKIFRKNSLHSVKYELSNSKRATRPVETVYKCKGREIHL